MARKPSKTRKTAPVSGSVVHNRQRELARQRRAQAIRLDKLKRLQQRARTQSILGIVPPKTQNKRRYPILPQTALKKAVPKVARASPARTLRPQEEDTRNPHCKERPNPAQGGGGKSRPFVPWCGSRRS